jgi:hypothetical protein
MALTKETVVDQITVTENFTILVRKVTRIMEDDIEISKQYHRTSFEKGADVSAQPQQVQNICAAAWKEQL